MSQASDSEPEETGADRTHDLGADPTGTSDLDLLHDLDLDDAAASEVLGGSATHVRLAPGDSRHRDVGGMGRPTPIARHAAGGILQRLAADAAKPARPAGAKVLTATRWLVADPKRQGAWKRADEATEGEQLGLEATVNPAQAPDGTAVDFVIFQESASAADQELDRLTGKVDAGLALVEWPCRSAKTAAGEEPKLSFKASVKGEQLRSPYLAIRSFVAFTVVDPDGKPLDAPYAATLPSGRERTGRSGVGGAPVRLPCPPGQVAVRLDGYAKAAGIELTIVDEAGQPIACGYKIRFADGTEAAGETGPEGRIAAQGAGEYELELVSPRS